MQRLIARAEAAFRACRALVVPVIQLAGIGAILAIIVNSVWGGPWGPFLAVGAICTPPLCLIAWVIWMRRRGEQTSTARWPKPLLAAGTLAYLAWTAARMGGWGIARGVELAVLIGAGALIAAGLWQEPWLGVPLGLGMFAAPWAIGRLVTGLALALGYITGYIIYKVKGR